MTLDAQLNLRRATNTPGLDVPSKTPDGTVETPTQPGQPPRADYRAMMFDRDGYALTQNRHLFAAAHWLAGLVETETTWPVAANDLRDHLAAAGRTPDHIDAQMAVIEKLVAPWLVRLRRTETSSEVC